MFYVKFQGIIIFAIIFLMGAPLALPLSDKVKKRHNSAATRHGLLIAIGNVFHGRDGPDSLMLAAAAVPND